MKKTGIKFLMILILLVAIISCGDNKQTKDKQEVNDTALARLDELNSNISNDPENSNLYHDRAKFYTENEEYNEALKDIGKALAIDSTYSDYYVTLSDIYLGMGKLQITVEALDKAIELDSKNINALLKLAEISIIFRDYDKALNYIDKALKTDELEAKGYFLRGVIMLENGDTIRGIRNFQKAIDVDQEYFDSHLQLGMLYADKKNKLAIDYFNNALNIEPSNTEVSYLLAMFYQETGEYDKAIQIYNAILDNNPEFYFALYNIGYINLVYLKEFEQAIEYFTKVIDINSKYADAYYNRGFAYELLGEVQNSKSDYKKTLEITANYEKAIDGLNRIDEFINSR